MGISRYKYNFNSNGLPLIKDKDALTNHYYLLMMDRLNQMFNVEKLPETIPKKDLLFIKHSTGCVTITKVNGKLYAFNGSLGGIQNEYYLPTLSIISNPYLNYSSSLEIDKDCVVILNDSMYMGLSTICLKYASLLAQCDISLYWAIVGTRVQHLYGAQNDSTQASMQSVLNHLENGDKLEVIATKSLTDAIKTYDYQTSGNNSIVSLIEARRYVLANFFKELGVPANDNGKREAINSAELSFDSGVQTPLIDNIMEEFKIGIDKVNAMYGTNIKVSLSSSWEMVRKEMELDLEEQDEDIESEDIVNGEEVSNSSDENEDTDKEKDEEVNDNETK